MPALDIVIAVVPHCVGDQSPTRNITRTLPIASSRGAGHTPVVQLSLGAPIACDANAVRPLVDETVRVGSR
jgi:hypothetical protein